MNTWRLKRIKQCAKCPWRKDVDPYDIPNGYDVEKHKTLRQTIADPDDIIGALKAYLEGKTLNIMQCHETDRGHCIGWLSNQLGPGNNIPLRLSMAGCLNAKAIRTIGPQHERFEDTLPRA